MQSEGIDSNVMHSYIDVLAGWPAIISTAMLLAIIIAAAMTIIRYRRDAQCQEKKR